MRDSKAFEGGGHLRLYEKLAKAERGLLSDIGRWCTYKTKVYTVL